MNACGGVVGVFNIQGAAFSREQRRFCTHDPAPPTLSAAVRPADIPALAGTAESFAVYQDTTQRLQLAGWEDAVALALAPQAADVVTIAPVLGEADGVQVAPVGLVGMLNPGGAVRSARLGPCADPGGEEEGWANGAGGEPLPAAGPRCEMELRGAGPFLCYASHRPVEVLLGGAAVQFSYDSKQAALRFDLPATGEFRHECVVQF